LQEALDDFEPRTPKVVSEPQEKIAGTLASVIAAKEAAAISRRVPQFQQTATCRTDEASEDVRDA
jgi:hypothetical protein